MKQKTQQGFTLIELIMVITILGILAAIAIPKFVDLGKDARIASVNAAKGALAATSAMAHGKYLVTSPAPASITVEGQTITFVNGYPKADAGLFGAAGFVSTDYNSDTTTAGTILVSPVSAPTAATCAAKYVEAASTSAAPTITVLTGGC